MIGVGVASVAPSGSRCCQFQLQLDVRGGPKEIGLLSHEAPGHVGRLLLVGIRVLHHPVLPYESFTTNITSERLLACM